MGDFDTGLIVPSPTMTLGSKGLRMLHTALTRPSILGPAEGAATLDNFALGKAELTPEHRKQLADLAVRLKRLIAEPPGGHVQVVGHTDKVDSEEKNKALGQKRADAVRDELVTLGIDATDVHTHSLGENVPVVDTPNANPRNRRVEVSFSPNSGRTYPGLLTGGLTRPAPIPATPPQKVPGGIDVNDICKTVPDLCAVTPPQPDFTRPIPPAPTRKLPSISSAVWDPIDRSLERGLRKLGLDDTWSKRLRDAARAGAEKGATEILDQTLDAAKLTGDTRKAVDAALRAAVQLEIPF